MLRNVRISIESSRLGISGRDGLWSVAKTVAAPGSDVKKSNGVEQPGATALWLLHIGPASLRWNRISSKAL